MGYNGCHVEGCKNSTGAVGSH